MGVIALGLSPQDCREDLMRWYMIVLCNAEATPVTRGAVHSSPLSYQKETSTLFDKCGHAHNYTLISASNANTFVCYRCSVCSLRKLIKMIIE